MIASRQAEAGQVVSAGQTVFTLAADGGREVLIALPESNIRDYKVGQPVQVLDELALVVGLAKLDLQPELVGAATTQGGNVGQGFMAISGRLAGAEQVEVGAVEHQHAVLAALDPGLQGELVLAADLGQGIAQALASQYIGDQTLACLRRVTSKMAAQHHIVNLQQLAHAAISHRY